MKPDRYDQVAVRATGGGYNMMSRRDFETMPLNKRVRLIMDDQVQFLLAGKVVSAREALAR